MADNLNHDTPDRSGVGAIGCGIAVKVPASYRHLAAALCLLAFPALADGLPDRIRTPGVTNPTVTQGTIMQTICVPGWTKTVRPPASYTNKLKLQQMKELGLTGDPHDFEEDHFLPIEDGGNPTDPGNLYPELWTGAHGAHRKDVVETYVKKLICSRNLTLAQGQAIFLGDWTAYYDAHFGPAAPH